MWITLIIIGLKPTITRLNRITNMCNTLVIQSRVIKIFPHWENHFTSGEGSEKEENPKAFSRHRIWHFYTHPRELFSPLKPGTDKRVIPHESIVLQGTKRDKPHFSYMCNLYSAKAGVFQSLLCRTILLLRHRQQKPREWSAASFVQILNSCLESSAEIHCLYVIIGALSSCCCMYCSFAIQYCFCHLRQCESFCDSALYLIIFHTGTSSHLTW